MRPLILAAIFAATTASAHDWYDRDCCHDRDCAPIPDTSVRITAEGYVVTIGPGDHFLASAPMTRIFPHNHPDVRPSRDGEYHTCVVGGASGEGWLRCLYVPLGY